VGKQNGGHNSIDWPSLKGTIDLAAVAAQLLGPAPGRVGEKGGLWWNCPLHVDPNPSFKIDAHKGTWRCYGCGEHGDAAALVMHVERLTFPEAIRFLAGKSIDSDHPRRKPEPRDLQPSGSQPSARKVDPAAALKLVEDAAARIWTPEGAEGLDYLHARGLTDETIRSARLGWTPRAEGVAYNPPGPVIPWFDGSRLVTAKVRVMDWFRMQFPEKKRPPKYLEAYRDHDRPPGLYPGPHVIRTGKPLVIVEGELDALLLGQELGDLAAVGTLGSASNRPTPELLMPMLSARPWFVAVDDDPAGEKAAGAWPASSRRVRPPGSFKDSSDAHQGGVNLRRWWSGRLAGVESPELFTWDELSALRWGPAVGDPEPGIVIDQPSTARMLAAFAAAREVDDPYAVAERLAIQAESFDP